MTSIARCGTGLIWLYLAMAAPGFAGQKAGFDLDIELSAKAAVKLRAQKEAIIVDASYYGDPAPDGEKYANEVGQIDLGSERLEIPGRTGKAHITGTGLNSGRLRLISGPVKVNVNIYSARKSSTDNLLACDFIDGELANVMKAPVILRCGLITERPETVLKP